MKAHLKTPALPAIVICLAVAAPALSSCGGDGDDGARSAAASRPAPSAPVDVALKPKHGAKVTGTAKLVPARDGVKVTVALSKPISGPLLAHIHTGPCSDEPTMSNPHIWVSLTEVVDGRSETTEELATLPDLQSEPTSINVHDPEHGNRPLVCGDIPRAG